MRRARRRVAPLGCHWHIPNHVLSSSLVLGAWQVDHDGRRGRSSQASGAGSARRAEGGQPGVLVCSIMHALLRVWYIPLSAGAGVGHVVVQVRWRHGSVWLRIQYI